MMKCFILSLVSVVVLLGTASCFTIKQNSTDEKSYIVGGEYVEDVVPYHVFLKCNGTYFCGGALISPQHVLTTAHCVEYMQLTRCVVTAHAGSIHRDHGGKYAYAAWSIYHPQYTNIYAARPVEHDIGVIKLRTPFPISDEIYPIDLTSYPPTDDEEISVTGFGKTNSYDYDASPRLKEYTSSLMTYEECVKFIHYARVFPTDICDIGVVNEGTCQGNSGSPVVDSNDYLIGVVSRGFTKGCVDNGIPNAFASVYYHLNFINYYLMQ